jgi:hypothetical protein
MQQLLTPLMWMALARPPAMKLQQKLQRSRTWAALAPQQQPAKRCRTRRRPASMVRAAQREMAAPGGAGGA